MTFNALELVQGIDTSTLADMTDTTTGGGSKRGLLPAGFAFAVFSSYIEYGKQPQMFDGKKKDPVLEFRLGFHIVGGVGTNLAGEDEDYVQDGFLPTISTWDTAQSRNEKSKAVKYFNAINIVPKGTHFIQKLGTMYLVEVKVTKNKKTGKDQNEFDFTSLQQARDQATRKAYTSYTNAAGVEVAMGELKPEDYKVFLWNRPTNVTVEQYQAMWDSIEIKGETEIKDKDGNVTGKRSKNFLQEKCQRALDFEGSSLQQLIGGVALPSITADDEAEAEPAEEETITPPPVDDEAELVVPPADEE